MKKAAMYPSAATPGGRHRVSCRTAIGRDVVVIAVPSVEQARMVLLASGQFEVCPGSDDSVIDRETDVQVRFAPNAGRD